MTPGDVKMIWGFPAAATLVALFVRIDDDETKAGTMIRWRPQPWPPERFLLDVAPAGW
jgi:hypothetical protein